MANVITSTYIEIETKNIKYEQATEEDNKLEQLQHFPSGQKETTQINKGHMRQINP